MLRLSLCCLSVCLFCVCFVLSLCLFVVCGWLWLSASLEQYLVSQGSSVASFVSLCDSMVDGGDEAIAVFLSLLSVLTDFEAWISMARDEAKRRYVKQIVAGYAAMAAQQQ